MNIQMTEAALKDCLGLPPAMAPGPSQILHCHLMAAPKSPSPRPPESLLLPWTNQGSQPMSMTLMSHVPLAVQPAQQLLLLPNILTIDGIFTTGFGSPKTWILPLTGPLPPADVEWRVLRQGKVPRHWDWGTPSYSLKDTGSKKKTIAQRKHEEGERGVHRMSNIKMRYPVLVKSTRAEQCGPLQSRSGSEGGMQSWTWVRAFHCHLKSNVRNFSALTTHCFYYHISAILAVL